MSQSAKFVEPNAYQTLENASAEIRQHSYAAPNRFEVMITPPKAFDTAETARRISLRCETINLPGRNLNSSPDTLVYGPTREVVDGITYAEDITMTFQASSEMDERVFFEEWQELAFNKQTWNVGYYNDYVRTVEIYLLDRQDQRRYGIKLIEAFPKTIGGTDLSQATNNEIIKTTVSFAFRYWETLDIERQPPRRTFETIVNSVERKLAENQPAVNDLNWTQNNL